MSGQLALSPSLPETIVSTDALESVGTSYMGNSYASDELPLQRKRQEFILAGSHFAQKCVTAAPLAGSDLLAVLGSFYAATLVLAGLFSAAPPINFFLEGLVVAGVFLTVGIFTGLYPATGSSPVFELKHSVQTTWIAFAALAFAEKTLAHLSPKEFWGIVLGAAFASVNVPLLRNLTRHLCAGTKWWGERALVVGSGAQARAIFRYYQRVPQRGLRPIGVVSSGEVDDDVSTSYRDPLIPNLGSAPDIPKIISRFHAHWGIVAPDREEHSEFTDSLKYCGAFHHVIAIPAGVSLPSLWTSSRECAGVTGFYLRDNLRSPFARALKRIMDIIGASIGLLVASPIFALAIVWVKLASPGPAFFGHERIGRNGRKFYAWKFRTMVPNAAQVLDDHLDRDPQLRQEWFRDQKLKNDPRIIPGIGHFLRKWSFDEIPQLWNILRGDMSLVGPRPIVTSEISKYNDAYGLYLRVTPGLTGLWQVSGRNNTSYAQRIRLDSYYVCNWSIWLDFYILFRTVRTVLFAEGAY